VLVPGREFRHPSPWHIGCAAKRKPPEAVEATRKMLHAQASRKQKTLYPRMLIAAEFLIIQAFLESFPSEPF